MYYIALAIFYLVAHRQSASVAGTGPLHLDSERLERE